MLLMPQSETTFIDPFTRLPTLNIICNIADPMTHENYSGDPRFVARKAVTYLERMGFHRDTDADGNLIFIKDLLPIEA